MIFDLISLKNYESKIDDYSFDDLGLKTLFDSFYDHNWSDLHNVLECIVKVDEIKKRQAIFTDFLVDDSDQLKTFKRHLEELRDAYKNYLSIDGGLKSYLLFVQYMEKLIAFFDKGTEILNNLDLKSNEMMKMRDFFNSKEKEESFNQLKEDYNKAILACQKMGEMMVSYVTGEKFIKTAKVKEGNIDLLKSIEDLMKRLDISIMEKEVNLTRHDLDAYYFNRLDYIYPEDARVLKHFFDKYSDKIKYDYDTLSTELNFYLKIKLLFDYAKEMNVSYSKAEINDEYNTDIYDLSDITIINKVDYIQPNDFHYDLYHHIQIVTGANGGGKTTYLRSVGANYIFFSSLGYTFSKSANIKPIKYLCTHFPNDENYQVGYGRLQDEIKRIDIVRNRLCKDCLYLMNETFSSTDEDTAFKESKKLFKELDDKEVNVVFITHQQLLLQYVDKEKVILLNPIVDVDDNNRRTFKIRRVDTEIHAFANDILRKYGLSKEMLDKKRRERDV